MFAKRNTAEQEMEKQAHFPGLKLFLYWFFALLYLESAVHFTVYDGFSSRFLYAAGLTAAIACL